MLGSTLFDAGWMAARTRFPDFPIPDPSMFLYRHLCVIVKLRSVRRPFSTKTDAVQQNGEKTAAARWLWLAGSGSLALWSVGYRLR